MDVKFCAFYPNFTPSKVITLTLLHPHQSIPVKCWKFDSDSVIRIGRSPDNQVVLYSSVVSRHHVELRRRGVQWELINLGSNGTYVDGKRMNQGHVINGMVIQLARSGPNMQIHFGTDAPKASAADQKLTQQLAMESSLVPEAAGEEDITAPTHPSTQTHPGIKPTQRESATEIDMS